MSIKVPMKPLSALCAAAAGFGVATSAPVSFAQVGVCQELDLPGDTVFGAGAAGLSRHLAQLSAAMTGLPEAERISVFYSDAKGACVDLDSWLGSDPGIATYKYWDDSGNQATCTDSSSLIEFVHVPGATRCLSDQLLPIGSAKFAAFVQAGAFITHIDSAEESISAAAAYHIYGLGAGAHDIDPWNEPAAVVHSSPMNFASVLLGAAMGVPAGQFVAEVPVNEATVPDLVGSWEIPDEALGIASLFSASSGESNGQTKTLAYQHFDQACGYLPDSERGRPDRANVRSGQYALWAPAWFYAHVDDEGVPINEHVHQLVAWFDGTLTPPAGVPVQEIVALGGDIPLCAMQALRPERGVSSIASYVHPRPCNGWYEFVTTGSTDYLECSSSADCNGPDHGQGGDVCRFGFCEAH